MPIPNYIARMEQRAIARLVIAATQTDNFETAYSFACSMEEAIAQHNGEPASSFGSYIQNNMNVLRPANEDED